VHTSQTLPKKKEMWHVWQCWLPERAVSQPFLMYGLTALSAFHLAHQRQPENEIWISLALRHQTKALHFFRSSLLAVTEQNCHDLFALSNLLIVMSLASSAFESPEVENASLGIGLAFEPLLLIRGTTEMLRGALGWLKNGPMANLLNGHTVSPPSDLSLPVDVDFRIDQLNSMILKADLEATVQQDVLQDLRNLEEIYREVSCNTGATQRQSGIVWKWPGLISEAYLSLLRNLHPESLVVFAHWVILSNAYEDMWHFRGWAHRALREIENVLDEEWREWLIWPKNQLKYGLTILKR